MNPRSAELEARIGPGKGMRMATGEHTPGFGGRLLRCEIAATLLAGGYLGQSFSAANRLYMYFGWRDTAAVLFLVAAAGLAAAALLQAAAWATRGRSDAALSPGFYFWAVLAGFNLFPSLRQEWVRHVPWLSGTVYYLMIWGLGLAGTVAGCWHPGWRRGAAWGWRRLALLWPLLLLLPIQLLTAPKWAGGGADPARLGRNASGTGAPVVVVILDMIGYGDAFTPEGAVREGLPAMSAFAETATVFHRARACGDFTSSSVPGLMLQEEVGDPIPGKDGVRWRSQSEPERPARLAGGFDRALPARFHAAGGRAVYIGYYLPYAELMPGAWDGVWSPCFYGVAPAAPRGAFATALLHHAVQYLIASKDPVAGVVKQFGLHLPAQNRYHRKITGDILAASRRYVRECLSPGDLALLHLTVPHPPIVFDAEGGESRFGREDPAGYPDQLRYADRLFGGLVDELKQAGRWDGSWVILMSDHGSHFQDWSADPAEKRHVPFMVKCPGQAGRQDVRKPIRLADFGGIPGFPPGSVRKGE